MMSSQRLITLLIAFNLIIGIIVGIHNNTNFNDLDDDMSVYDNYVSEFMNDDLYSGVQNKNQIKDITIGNTLSWGRIVVSILLAGINPLSIQNLTTETQFENILLNIFTIFRIIVFIFLILEIYFIIKNRKNT